MKQEKELKMEFIMNASLKIAIITTILLIIGFSLIVYSSGWVTALGVFLIVWSQNFENPNKINIL